jgi:nucleotide-binding universal stress UspA family protein
MEVLRQRSENALDNFESIARSLGVSSLEKRLIDEGNANGATNGISVQARYCDLAVLGQFDPNDPYARLLHDLPEHVAMNSGSAVLILPNAGRFDTLGERILIGWDGSLQAARAVRQAIPLLKRAKSVHVVSFQPVSQPDEAVVPMCSGIAAYLSCHGVRADVLRKPCNETTEGGMGDLLLSQAAELGSDLLVMGCYGHSRFREFLLGGATHTMLSSMTIPVLMTHSAHRPFPASRAWPARSRTAGC